MRKSFRKTTEHRGSIERGFEEDGVTDTDRGEVRVIHRWEILIIGRVDRQLL